MPLTKEQKKRIYEEELERIKARERIEAERARKQQTKSSARAINWVIILGFLLMIYIMFGGGN
ncbi:hypothetical protein [Sporomusa termitida]|uniref:ENTH domain-containing protein n=1 Tax=Sporomusa termitida TaxID=2377 RepID=A0A517DSP3_9FIRM|nr:hypothetical protein [Sporomusa termitida]QDR80306.1 hypothetical protein SPTER_16290 [Sporomusa termitida]